MNVVLVTEAQQTERAITALIILLLVVALMLALLTAWYWRYTSPRRYVRKAMVEADQFDLDGGHDYALDQVEGVETWIDLEDPYQRTSGGSQYR